MMSNDTPCFCALDMATVTGFCVGKPGQVPLYGHQRLAPEGASNPAVFAGAFKMGADLARDHGVNRMRYEATIDPRHLGKKTTRAVGLRLIGIPGAVVSAFYLCGVLDIQEIRAQKVRDWLLGYRPKGTDASKAAVMAAVADRGYETDDDNAADAVATWLYSCHEAGY